MSPEYGRLAIALLLSLLIHTLLLSLTFGVEGLGLPGFGFPWRDRRIEAPEVRVVLHPMHPTAGEQAIASLTEPLRQGSIEQTIASGPVPTPSMSRARSPKQAVTAGAAPARAPTRADGPNHVAPAQVQGSAAVDVAPPDGPASLVRAAPSAPTAVIAVAPSAPSPETVASAARDAGDVAGEAARLAAVQEDAQREEVARQEESARLEAARREAERQEAARLAAAQEEAQREELARQEEAARLEAARREVERQEAARLTAAQQEAQRQELARREEAARLEAARLAAAQLEAARVRAEQEAKREAVLREIGRQLDEEAARREKSSIATRLPSTLAPSLSTARRVRLWGRADPNAELIRYAEAWERKIQLNTPVDSVRDVAKRLHTNPMVTVAIRSDGSVESVTIVRSSGVAEVDEAIRRIVQSHEHYPSFPPALAREFDVIEIRRTWSFDEAVRFY